MHLIFFVSTCTQATAKGFVLIQTKEVSMRPEDVNRVFQNNAESLTEWITKGTVMYCVIINKSMNSLLRKKVLLHVITRWCVFPSGPVVALELNGDGVVEACRSFASEMFNGTKVDLKENKLFLFIENVLWTCTFFFMLHSTFSCSCLFLRAKIHPHVMLTTFSTLLTCRWDCEAGAMGQLTLMWVQIFLVLSILIQWNWIT